MRISYEWLKEFIDLSETPQEIAEILTLTGLEVEGVERYESIPGGLEGVWIGYVERCEPHPNADRLKVCQVRLGDGQLRQIVCGAPNVAAGQKVAVALPGTTLHPKEGKPFTLSQRKIRGVLSQGMICSTFELGIGDDKEGIWVLEKDAPVGAPLNTYVNIYQDWILEVGLTPNRTDAMGHLGVARDIAAYLKRPLKPLPTNVDFSKSKPCSVEILIESKEGCPLYAGVVVENVDGSQQSPFWLQQRLQAVGQRPINLLVDLTNYVLLGIGQPLHAFDLEKIAQKTIIVRQAQQSMPFTTLDGVTRTLAPQDLLICDKEKPLVIAGIMGGLESGVSDSTKSIFLESAYFNPRFIRHSVRRLQLFTESAFRFERGADPNSVETALLYYLYILCQHLPQCSYSTIKKVQSQTFKAKRIQIHLSHFEKVIGTKLSMDTIKETLEALEIPVQQEGGQWFAYVPFYRHDVNREQDVMEEFLRIYGYNKVPLKKDVLVTPDVQQYADKAFFVRWALMQRLTGMGWQEIITNPLIDERWETPNSIRLQNPLSEKHAILRFHPVFGGIEVLAENLHRQIERLKLVEWSKVFYREGDAYKERLFLAFWLASKPFQTWQEGKKQYNFFTLKNNVYQFLYSIGMRWSERFLEDKDYFAYGVELLQNKEVVGGIAALQPKFLRQWEIAIPVYFAWLTWEALFRALNTKVVYRPVSLYPAIQRDVSMYIEPPADYQQIEKTILNAHPKWIEAIWLFDVYEEKERRSYTLRITFRAQDRTLTDKQVDKAMKKIFNALEKIEGITLRI